MKPKAQKQKEAQERQAAYDALSSIEKAEKDAAVKAKLEAQQR